MTDQIVSQQRSLDQKRAAAAWEAIREIQKEKDDDLEKKYKPLAGSGATDVQTNGLGQTMAFWRAKSSGKESIRTKANKLVYRQTSDWVKKQLKVGAQTDLVEWLATTASTDQYRWATAEAQAFLIWLRRFAEAELKGELHGKED